MYSRKETGSIFLWSIKAKQKNIKLAKKKKEEITLGFSSSCSDFTFRDKSLTVFLLLIRIKGVSVQTSRCVIKLCPIMAARLLQSRLKLN